MAFVVADRVQDTTTTTGTGTVTLSGTAPTGYQNFSVVGNGNTTFYTIAAGSEWEVGIGTYATAGPTLARTTILASSNAGAAVNFSAGTKAVFVTYPAEYSVFSGTTTGANALSVDRSATANGGNATAVGVSANATGDGAVAVGYGAYTNNDNTLAVGRQANASYNTSTAIGAYAVATAANQIVFGTASETVSLIGGRIQFPATQVTSSDANTLDDYEVGTFTPSLTFGGGSTGMTYSSRYGFYQKVGNWVKGSANLHLSAKGSSTGGAAVSGLPFTTKNTAGNLSVTSVFGNFNSVPAAVLITNPNATKGDLTYSVGGDIDNTNFSDSTYFTANFDYMTA